MQSKGLLRFISNTTVQKHQFFGPQLFIVQLSHPYMTTGKTIALTRWIFVNRVISLLFNMLSRLAIAFLPGSKCLLIPWLQSPSAVILEPKKIKSLNCLHCFPIYLPRTDGTMILVFSVLTFKPTFSLSCFTFIKRLFSPSSVSVISVASSTYLRLLIYTIYLFPRLALVFYDEG